LTRHELKDQLQHDHFTDAVSNVISYAESHRATLIRAGIAILAVAILAAGTWWYQAEQSEKRQQELSAAMSILDAQVGGTSDFAKTYPTEDAKKDAFAAALSSIIGKYQGTKEGLVAQYYRGTARAQKGDVQGAESDLRTVADSSSGVAPLAKIALVNLYLGDKKGVEAQTLLQGLVKDPTPLVSKAQAEILQAQVDQSANPQAAKDALKSIDPAAGQRPAVKRAVEQLNTQFAK
jgi:tetratricopeptide repeat protein